MLVNKSVIRFTLVALMACLFSLSVQADSNKWRISFNHSAKNDGVIIFKVTPKDESPVEVRVEVEEGDSENRVANDAERAFTKALGRWDYRIERDDFEDVLVKKDIIGADNFDLELVSNSVDGISVKVRKE